MPSSMGFLAVASWAAAIAGAASAATSAYVVKREQVIGSPVPVGTARAGTRRADSIGGATHTRVIRPSGLTRLGRYILPGAGQPRDPFKTGESMHRFLGRFVVGAGALLIAATASAQGTPASTTSGRPFKLGGAL